MFAKQMTFGSAAASGASVDKDARKEYLLPYEDEMTRSCFPDSYKEELTVRTKNTADRDNRSEIVNQKYSIYTSEVIKSTYIKVD